MSATFEHQIEDDAGILPAGPSLLSSLQTRRAELAREGAREIRKVVPLWAGALSIVYRYPEGGTDAIIKAVERAQQRGKPEDVFAANCNTLLACCHTVEGRQPDGDWEHLDPDNAAPVKFTERLARLLQIDVPDTVKSKPRFILRHVFSPAAAATGVFDGDLSLMTQAGQVLEWLSASDAQADEELRGE